MTGNRSKLMSFYNKARAQATGLDKPRVNRALGLVMAGKVRVWSSERITVDSANGGTYTVSWNGRFHCDCPDHEYRQTTCKHIIAAMITLRAAGHPQCKPKPAPRPRKWANGSIARMRQCMKLARAA